MKDNRIRRVVKRIALGCYTVDLKVTQWIRAFRGDKPLYRLCGSCNGCGACCESPMIQVSPLYFYFKSVRRLLLAWHRWVNGFEYIGHERRSKTLIFRCTHWDPATGKCDSYDSRPGMCRNYPRNLLYDPNPEFLQPCSYYAIDNNADAMRAALAELSLPPEKLRELERKLRVTEPANSKTNC